MVGGEWEGEEAVKEEPPPPTGSAARRGYRCRRGTSCAQSQSRQETRTSRVFAPFTTRTATYGETGSRTTNFCDDFLNFFQIDIHF